MYRSQHRRNKDFSVQPQPSSMPVVLPAHSHSQSSLSSLSSSDASSSLHSAGPVPASNSSQADISSDQTLSIASPTSTKNRFFPLSKSASRTPPLLTPQMGQSLSRPTPALASSNESTSSGSKLKRVFAGRRKKPEDVSVLLGGQQSDAIGVSGKGKDRDLAGRSSPMPGTPVSPKGADLEVQQSQPPRQAKGAKNIIPLQLSSSLNMFGSSRRQSQSPKSPKFSGSAPLQSTHSRTGDALSIKKLPLTPTATPPSSSTITSFAPTALVPPASEASTSKPETTLSERPDPEMKQDWRKSDSTMTSHVTIRPGFNNRSPRPVSLAESSHSGHTVVVNKRLSAMITDADFATPEESDTEQDLGRGGRPSPTPSLKAIHRRSMSLSPSYGMRMKSGSPEPGSLSDPPHSSPVSPISTSRDTPTLTRAAVEGFITPTSAPGATHSTSSNIRGKLAAWSATPSSPSRATTVERPLPSPPVPRQTVQNHPPVSQPQSFRQTAVSMTGSLAPVAAGIAIGIGKRVHRVWGGLSSNSSAQPPSAYSSTSSVDQVGPSSYHGHGRKPSEDVLGGRSHSSQALSSQAPPTKSGWRNRHRTPNAPSGTWSVASSTASSVSECEALIIPSGPNLGTKLRGAMRNGAGSPVAGGLVFGRRLDLCVRQTAVNPDSSSSREVAGIRPLEDRQLPALVTRCAQHLLQWGVQEEGLFRVSGRPAHVAKLRSEFDTGADYNLVECDPGDLDPHAVASIFKAYLRELPESILTAALAPQFDAIITAENTEAEASTTKSGHRSIIGGKGPTLPSGPRTGISLRKPPSLSTLAMPNFAGMRTVSPAAHDALAALIARLPPENRDLLITVTELITATATCSKETKMPLGNLLVVFCPSLNMNPSLLRVFCDAKDIWNGPSQPKPVTLPTITVETDTDQQRRSATPQSDSDIPLARPRPGGAVSRDPLATLYVPNDHPIASIYQRSSSNSGSYVSALEGPADPDTRPSTPSLGSLRMPPPLTSSTDSLATPSTMSEVSSFSKPPSLSSQSSAVDSPNRKLELNVSSEPVIVEDSELGLPAVPRRPAISSPIPFPSSSDNSAPHTPLHTRKSFALLSFPPLRTSEASSASNSSSSSTWGHLRTKRPSLHLLFSKKSTPSLKQTPTNVVDEAPNSAPATKTDYTRSASPSPGASLAPPAVAPTLTTPISSSPIGLAFNDSAFESPATALDKVAPEDTIRLVHGRVDSNVSSLYTTPQETPVADHFRNLLPPAAAEVETPISGKDFPRSPSALSLTPSITLGFEDEDDWAQSVLMATQSDDAKLS
ncbi:RhoGAP-domain-containing protein [Cristinia sonorae]|uniref:RhoGAP-domain-containing protein n=1 Tax=Cristinia sonorae TaxID=1940300 RepID=A0A8K0XKR9_9AGAR|nr:RhoGAP-domain-containing protein [Cristinia sonorae]